MGIVRTTIRVALIAAPLGLLFLAGVAPAGGQPSVRKPAPRILGVFDGDTGLPVEGAQVTDVARELTAVTSGTGTVSLRFLPDGESLVRIRKVGYEPAYLVVKNSPADTVSLTVVLNSLAQRLPAIISRDASHPLSPGLSDFEERQRAGRGGRFLGADVLRKNDNSSMASVIATLPGLKVTCSPFPPECHATATRQLTRYAIRGGACEPDIYLEGILMTDKDLSKLQVRDYGGIEFYEGGASIPIQYNKTGSSCGVLLLWTRER